MKNKVKFKPITKIEKRVLQVEIMRAEQELDRGLKEGILLSKKIDLKVKKDTLNEFYERKMTWQNWFYLDSLEEELLRNLVL